MLVAMKKLVAGLVLAAALLLPACWSDGSDGTPGTSQQVEGDASVTGEVTYPTRTDIPPKARVEVTLENISAADPASVIIGRQEITDPKDQPIPFEISYSSGAVDEDAAYAVKVTVFKGDDLWMINRETVQVITGGNPTSGVEVVVGPIG